MRGGIASFFDVMTSRIQQAKRVRVHESSALGIYAKTEAIVDFKGSCVLGHNASLTDYPR
jgi:hypothetical protein